MTLRIGPDQPQWKYGLKASPSPQCPDSLDGYRLFPGQGAVANIAASLGCNPNSYTFC